MHQCAKVVKFWLKGIMGSKHHWMRCEYQWRTGGIHVHGVAWLTEPEGGI
jgi:hypothetical protein